MNTYTFSHNEGLEADLEVDCDSFEEAAHIMFSGEFALDPEDWSLDSID